MGVIDFFIRLVMDSAVSLRAAARVIESVAPWLPGPEQTPTAACGQNWLLRLGLHALERPKEEADDWMWIVDHTIQLGNYKVLLVVGMRLSAWNPERGPLSHQDLEIILMEPVTQSTGEVVQEQLHRAAEKTGPPCAILSDEGTDLTRGIGLFCASYPQTARLSDIKHQAARLVKRQLQDDPRWKEFLHRANQTKALIRQTELAYLMPPPPRVKARFMNADVFMKWGRDTLRYLERERPERASGDSQKLSEKLGWLAEFRDDLSQWEAMFGVVGKVLEHVRQDGYHRQAAAELGQILKDVDCSTTAGRVAQELIDIVRQQSSLARQGEHLLGSSEVLESLIGKGKRLHGQHSQGGFTKMILSMAAAVVRPTATLIGEALTAIKTADLALWTQEHLGVSLITRRRQAYSYGTKPG